MQVRSLFFVFISSIFFISSIYSQQWIKESGGPFEDRVTAVTTDKSGNIYITGFQTSGTGNVDYYTAKYNPGGQQMWAQTYNGPGSGEDKAFGIAVDNVGNVIVTGYSTGVGSQADFTTIKYRASDGNQLWVSRYNEPGNGDDKAFGIAVDRIGNIYVTGYITRIGTDIYTIKYNSNGVYIWGQLINGTANDDDKAFGIAVDSLGDNIYICGYTTNDTTGVDFTTARYDSTGVLLWEDKYNGFESGEDRAFGIVVDTDENIFVTGYSTGANSREDCLTIRYLKAGDTSWVARYNGGGNHNDRAFGIVVDTDGNSYITGYTVTEDTVTTDYLTVKYNFEGVQQWAKTYDGSANYQDTAFAICFTHKNPDYVFITGGSSSDTIPGKMDIVTIRYNVDNGVQDQINRYNGEDNLSDAGTAITADTSGNVYVAGYTESNANGYQMFLAKFLGGELIGINVISTEVPQSFKLYQNYPNPFNPVTTIKFDIQKASFVKLKIYDILGREVAVLVNENLKIGTYEAVFVTMTLASGLYFYELTANDFKEVKKMILVK
ncbi:MAG: SBBP repeat-containing protein [Chlorobi bacterium]|nr:SBBP repeat-containing protein [Chlorobiota bacterium]MCI0715618.1 SBBP repeat-containing protein [Chlorobiota bacterium]